MKNVPDPFHDARKHGPVMKCPVHGEDIAMLLRHGDVRAAAKDWQTFSSNAPFRVPIPSEEAVRSIRQLPIETNPPEHSEWRAIVQPFFDRPKQPEVMARVEALIDGLLDQAQAGGPLEVVGDFALPLQSRALTYLLNVPECEADTWIGWGVHVFKGEGGEFKKGIVLEDYLNAQFDRAVNTPGDDFFSALAQATYQGRPLTRDEMLGFGNLTFAGGLHAHEAWWDTIWLAQRERGMQVSTLTPEFGPAPYMQLVPFTQQPVADLGAICDWMATREAARFAE